MKLKKTELLRTRVEPGFKSELVMFAQAKKLDTSDIVRIACTEFMQRHSLFSNVIDQKAQ